MDRHTRRGFTLVEQLIVLGVTSIVLMMGVPSFSRLLARSQVQSAASQLALTMAQARMRAVGDQSSWSLCASRDGASCNGDSDWSRGWILFADPREAGILGAAMLKAAIDFDNLRQEDFPRAKALALMRAQAESSSSIAGW